MAQANDLSCQELVEIVTDYLEDALSAADRQRFEGHLTECDGCDRYLDQMRTTIDLVGRLHENGITPEARERLLTEFRDWKRT